MTNKPEPITRAGEAQAHQLATALMGVERFTADGNFHPDYLAMLTRPLPQPSELVAEVKRLTTLADDHFRNARRLSEVVVARDAQIAKLQADGDKLAEALEAFQRHYDLNDCDERCGALEVPISDLRRARRFGDDRGDPPAGGCQYLPRRHAV